MDNGIADAASRFPASDVRPPREVLVRIVAVFGDFTSAAFCANKDGGWECGGPGLASGKQV